ncbi:hypothetical protein ISS07_06890 [Candidatus Woesearchaeota archaeon]|nr:hypothetical protein [Candidatus Woesearchaeota archaeon]
MNLKKNEKLFFGITILIFTIIFFYVILGIAGSISILAIVLFFIFPTYTFLNNFKIDFDEKIILSFFIGIGIFPSITYWLGIVISFKLAIVTTLILILIISYLVGKFKKNNLA